MGLVEIVSIIGIPSMISGIAILILTRSLNKRDRKQTIALEQERIRQQEIRKQNEELEKQNKAIAAGVQALLRDRLLQGYKHYFEKGWADYNDRDNMENIYTQYHSLGQNGVMDEMRHKFLQLPLYENKEG